VTITHDVVWKRVPERPLPPDALPVLQARVAAHRLVLEVATVLGEELEAAQAACRRLEVQLAAATADRKRRSELAMQVEELCIENEELRERLNLIGPNRRTLEEGVRAMHDEIRALQGQIAEHRAQRAAHLWTLMVADKLGEELREERAKSARLADEVDALRFESQVSGLPRLEPVA
jgi:hypothetical protein